MKFGMNYLSIYKIQINSKRHLPNPWLTNDNKTLQCVNFVVIPWDIVYNKATIHDDVIKWKHLSRYWTFVRGIHRSPVNSPHKGQWRGALLFSLICAWINGWVNNREAGVLRRHLAHYDVTVMGNAITIGYTLTNMCVFYSITASSAKCHMSDHCRIACSPRQKMELFYNSMP